MRATIDLHDSILNPSVFRSRSEKRQKKHHTLTRSSLSIFLFLLITHTSVLKTSSLRLDTTLFRMVLSSWTDISISYRERKAFTPWTASESRVFGCATVAPIDARSYLARKLSEHVAERGVNVFLGDLPLNTEKSRAGCTQMLVMFDQKVRYAIP